MSETEIVSEHTQKLKVFDGTFQLKTRKIKNKIHKTKVDNMHRLLTNYGFNNSIRQKELWDGENMGIQAKKSIKIEDGLHTGIVKRVEFVTEPYSYTEIYIEETVTKLEIRCGVPTSITDMSNLGILLQNFGVDLHKAIEQKKEFEESEIEEVFEGKKAQFVTINEKTERGSFPRIQAQSLKPIK